MSILDIKKEFDSYNQLAVSEAEAKTKISPEKLFTVQDADEAYVMTEEGKNVMSMILKHFSLGYITMQRPRVEFNDMSVLGRQQYNQMLWNNYQANNGEALPGNELASWKSNALRPIIRNKIVSIAAHATARLIFPRVFAYSKDNQEQKEAATVMGDLMEWAADKSDYAMHSLERVITALVDPVSIGYTEYCEHYRFVKTDKEDGKWNQKRVVDEELSGFKQACVPLDQLYIENFYEPDIQKQGWLIWRRVLSYSILENKYASLYPNFKFVKPGVQLIYNDANQTFYYVYDPNMRQELGEEIIYWNRTLDLKVIMVNGVMLTDADNPNPRNDKLYPFDKFGYQMINTKCFYYKSLADILQQDAKIINDLYNMIIDGTYLNVMPPMVNVGGEIITADVIVPGAVTTLSDPNSDLRAIQTTDGQKLRASMETMFKVEESINQTSSDPTQATQGRKGNETAYEISRREQESSVILGLFVKMIGKHVKDFGRLRMGDILQYLTIADVSAIEENEELIYRTFVMPNKSVEGKTQTRRIKFDNTLAEAMTEEEKLNKSYQILEEEGGKDSKTQLYLANPKMFRESIFHLTVSPDVLMPKSEEVERAFNLEEYDRLIANPIANQEEALRLLLGAYDNTKKDPDKYINKQEAMPAMQNLSASPEIMNQINPQSNKQPANAMGKKLPQTAANVKI